MKRTLLFVALLALFGVASANSVRYFTYNQVTRTVNFLNQQSEMMIYCGYEYELPTYVIISDIWSEPINPKYFEVWLFGYDAYTGDEIYMPLDLGCVWLYGRGQTIYNAAQYLRFSVRTARPSFVWEMPTYNTFVRVPHPTVYVRTYHWDVHQHGWMPPAPGPGMNPAQPPYHPYYMRPPSAPAPKPMQPWTPGKEKPTISTPVNTTREGNRGTVTYSGTRDNGGNNNQPPTTNTQPGSSRASSTGTSTSTSRTTTNSRSTTAGTTTSRSTSGTTGTGSSRTGVTTSGSQTTRTGSTSTTTSTRTGTSTGTSTSGSSRTGASTGSSSTSGTTRTGTTSGTSTSSSSTSRTGRTGTTTSGSASTTKTTTTSTTQQRGTTTKSSSTTNTTKSTTSSSTTRTSRTGASTTGASGRR